MKKEMRAEIRLKAQRIDEEARIKSDKLIINNLLSLEDVNNANTIFCFVGIGNEVSTTSFIEIMLQRGKRIAVPLCIGKGIMQAKLIKSMSELSPGLYNIPEPSKEAETILPSEIDLAVLPCVTCDKSCNRLGQGGGYYDRYLTGDFKKIAVCRETLMAEKVPIEDFDKPVDSVITESNLYSGV